VAIEMTTVLATTALMGGLGNAFRGGAPADGDVLV